jgi:L-aspartate oxidase
LTTDPSFPQSLSGFDSKKTPILRADVLVIGVGVAGASAALAAAEAGASVLLLHKTPAQESNTAYAQGGVAAVLGGDDTFALHEADTLRVGAGLADRAAVREIVGEGPSAVAWLQEFGATFDTAAEGHLMLSREGGHSVSRVVHAHGDATGKEMQRALHEAVLRHPRITCREEAFVRDLLIHEGRCVGALASIGRHDRHLELAIEASAVMLATGGAGQVYRETTNPIGASGDGMALAFRAGAVLADMEFVQFHPTTLYIAGAARSLISEVVRGAGAVLVDRKGERFMHGVHPMKDLAPRDVVSRAILDRMVETEDTHVFLDLRPVRGNPHELFPSISKICASFDIDIARDPIPVRPGAHYFVGGVKSDVRGTTSIPGLYALGECSSSGLHGANRLASNSLLEGVVVGRIAGRHVADQAHSAKRALPRECQARPPLPNPPKLHLDDVLYSLKSLMWLKVGLKRDRDGLLDAIERIGLWNHYLIRAGTHDPESCELANMLAVSALVATAALQREESRGTHFRNDHARRDDERFCRHLLCTRSLDGSIAVRAAPLQAPSDTP